MSSITGFVQKDHAYQNLTVYDTLVTRKLNAAAIEALTVTTNTLNAANQSGSNVDGKNITPASVTTADVTVTNQLLLPTSGGVPTNLNYYEEFSSSFVFTSTIFSVGTTIPTTFSLVRVGKQVTLTITAISHITDALGSNGTINASGSALPERFRPILTGQSATPMSVVSYTAGVDNGAGINVIATLNINGNLILYKNTFLVGVFTASGNIVQVQAMTFSYTVL